jgi:hypothetical protein
VIVVDNELIIQIYYLSTFWDSWEVLASSFMYKTTMPSFTELTTTMLEEELCCEIKGTWKVEHEGLNVNHYNNTQWLPFVQVPWTWSVWWEPQGKPKINVKATQLFGFII